MHSERRRFEVSVCTSMRFDAQLVALPVVQDADTLNQFLGSAPQSVCLKYKIEQSGLARERQRLRGDDRQDWPCLS